MLKNTLDNTMKKAMKHENITRATRFGKNCDADNEKTLEKEFLMIQKISKYTKKEEKPVNADEIVIIEDNINDNIPMIKYKLNYETNLPFFKPIQYKLSEVFGA